MIERFLTVQYLPYPRPPRRQIFKLSSVREEKVRIYGKITTSLLMENKISYNYQIF